MKRNHETTTPHKLTLHRETLHELNTSFLKQVIGGKKIRTHGTCRCH